MNVDIRHRPAYASAYMYLDYDEAVHVERGAMAWHSDAIDVSAGIGSGGITSAIGRKMFGGEGILFGRYVAEVEGAFVCVTPPAPGDIEVIRAEEHNPILVTQGSLLAFADTVTVDTSYAGLTNVLLREGVTMLRLSGHGAALVSAFGGIEHFGLGDGQRLIVDSGHLVAHTADMVVRSKLHGGAATSALTGEGIVAEFTGPGELWLQTRAEAEIRSWLFPERYQNERSRQ